MEIEGEKVFRLPTKLTTPPHPASCELKLRQPDKKNTMVVTRSEKVNTLFVWIDKTFQWLISDIHYVSDMKQKFRQHGET